MLVFLFMRKHGGGRKPLELTGKRFGKLFVVRRATLEEIPTVKYTGAWWWVKCDCGNSKAIIAGSLKHVKACGCLEAQNRTIMQTTFIALHRHKKPYGDAAKNSVFQTYKRGAKMRGLKWDLSFEQFLNLTSTPCHYCGETWSMESGKKANGSYKRNGIDRVNNKVGYEIKNCVPCCKTCNFVKGSLTMGNWTKVIKWAKKVAKFTQEQKNAI